MKYSIVAAVVALGSTALAQSVPGLPQCAQTCFGNNLGSCGPLDIACICKNTSVINNVSCCVFATCSQADIQTTITFASQLCKANGVDVNTNPSCPSGSASASSSARPSASGSGSASTTPAASGSSTAAVSGVTGTGASRTVTPAASGAASTGAAPLPTAAGYGVGLAGVLAGMLAAM